MRIRHCEETTRMSMLLDGLEDDNATLEAALALIDEWELEFDALPSVSTLEKPSSETQSTDSDTQSVSSSSSPVSSPPPAPVSKQMKRRKERSDDAQSGSSGLPPVQMQRREELVFLRRKLRELESQLTTIESEKAAAQQEKTPKTSEEISTSWVWQQIASRQLKHRQRSENENLRLRVMVEEQLKAAKDLMRLLMRAYERSQEQHASSEHPHKRVKMPKDGLGTVSIELQLARVEELRLESEIIFSSMPYTDPEPVFRKTDLYEHENGETTINVDCSWVLPFSVDMVASAFWRYLVKKTSCPMIVDGSRYVGCDTSIDITEKADRAALTSYPNEQYDTLSAPYQANALAKQHWSGRLSVSTL